MVAAKALSPPPFAAPLNAAKTGSIQIGGGFLRPQQMQIYMLCFCEQNK
jgi:hypothetical protein